MSSFEKALNLISRHQFFSAYVKSVKNYRHKWRKVDGNKKPIDFSDQDKAAIAKGLRRFARLVEKAAAEIDPLKKKEMIAMGDHFDGVE